MRTLQLHGAVALALAAGGCGLLDSAPPPTAPQATGNDQALLVLLERMIEGREGFGYWRRGAAGDWQFGGEGVGRPLAACAWGPDLLVFLPTGRYVLFHAESAEVFPPPVPGWSPMAVCADAEGVDAFGWDADSNPVYARFEQGAWRHERIRVAMDRRTVLDPAAARFKDRTYLVWREEVTPVFVGPPTCGIRFIYLQNGEWVVSGPSRIRLDSPPRVAASTGRMACLYRKPGGPVSPGPWALATYETADEDFHEVGPLDWTGPTPEGPLALACLGEAFFVVDEAQGRPRAADLDVETGQAETFASIQLADAPSPADSPRDYQLVLLGVVFVTFLLLLGWRDRAQQQGWRSPPVYPPGMRPAPLPRRAGALAIDYLLVIMVVAMILYTLYPDSLHRFARGEAAPLSELLVIDALKAACTVLYFGLSEGLTGRTLGKAILGLEVRSASGEPLTPKQSALRNVIRIVDALPGLYLVGFISILLGPKPQRLGDRAAGTMVVPRTPGRSGR